MLSRCCWTFVGKRTKNTLLKVALSIKRKREIFVYVHESNRLNSVTISRTAVRLFAYRLKKYFTTGKDGLFITLGCLCSRKVWIYLKLVLHDQRKGAVVFPFFQTGRKPMTRMPWACCNAILTQLAALDSRLWQPLPPPLGLLCQYWTKMMLEYSF